MDKLLVGTALAAIAGGAIYLFAKPQAADVYPLPQASVYDKLIHASVSGGENGVFHQGAPSMTGNGSDEVDWVGHATTCTLQLTAVDANSTRVAASCGKPGDTDVTSWGTGQLRNRVIEAVDANLTGRAYDPDKAEEGRTAANWPADTVAHTSAAAVVGNTLKAVPGAVIEQARMQAAVSQSSAQSAATVAPAGDAQRYEDAQKLGCVIYDEPDPTKSRSDTDRAADDAARQVDTQTPGCSTYYRSYQASPQSRSNPWAK